MEFLLILSALLSAVTGAFTGVRAPEARHHQAATTVESVAPVAPRAVRAVRSVAIGAAAGFVPLPAARPEAIAFALKLPAPLATVRLLE